VERRPCPVSLTANILNRNADDRRLAFGTESGRRLHPGKSEAPLGLLLKEIVRLFDMQGFCSSAR
jgi:hypothetical protein